MEVHRVSTSAIVSVNVELHSRAVRVKDETMGVRLHEAVIFEHLVRPELVLPIPASVALVVTVEQLLPRFDVPVGSHGKYLVFRYRQMRVVVDSIPMVDHVIERDHDVIVAACRNQHVRVHVKLVVIEILSAIRNVLVVMTGDIRVRRVIVAVVEQIRKNLLSSRRPKQRHIPARLVFQVLGVRCHLLFRQLELPVDFFNRRAVDDDSVVAVVFTCIYQHAVRQRKQNLSLRNILVGKYAANGRGIVRHLVPQLDLFVEQGPSLFQPALELQCWIVVVDGRIDLHRRRRQRQQLTPPCENHQRNKLSANN
mmetsp:Transcript_3468/g.9896  ORF Transcript_3468/g.9896 Transcript_3468/m.9896 type:complete len:310 (-) Transcript_3468:2381-3310(-)